MKLKTLNHIPKIPGITKKTARFLRLKSAFYLLTHDGNKIFRRFFWKHPFKYSWNLLNSYARKKAYAREGDFFLYGYSSIDEFNPAPDQLVVLGFSYCHKPLECPSGRFNDQCIRDQSHPVCQQCFIGKTIHSLPPREIKLYIIPTVHYIGEKLFELLENRPAHSIVFLITACELTLEMFSDWGNMLQIRGIGVRLDGRICNTMKAFKLSEVGIKPGLTIVQEPTQHTLLDLLTRSTNN